MVRTSKWWLGLAAAGLLALPGRAHAAVTSYWNFNDGNPVTSDSGPANIDLTLVGTATYGYIAPGNYALQLDGSGGLAGHAGSGPLLVPTAAAPRTIIGWLKPDNTNPGGTIISWGDGPGLGPDFNLLITKVSGQTYLYSDGQNAANNLTILPSNVPAAGQWSQIAFVFDGTNWRYYLNGDERQSGTVSINTAPASYLFVGARTDATGPSDAMLYPGLIDELKIFDTALTSADVLALFDTQGPVVSAVTPVRAPTQTSNMGLTALATDTANAPVSGNSNIASAVYAINGGAWVAMAAADGAFDETSEGLTATVPAPLGGWNPGDQVCVKATDAAGNTGAEACAAVPFDNDPPAVTVLNVENPVAINTQMTLNATISDVGHGGSWILGAAYTIDGGAPVAMNTVTSPLTSATEAFRAFPVMTTVGSHTVCVSGYDGWGNWSAEACTTVKVYDQYAHISGAYKPNVKKGPELTYDGFVALSGAEILGQIRVTYKRATVKTTCTFTPGTGSLTIVDGDYALLMGWTRTCTNGETGTSTDILLTDASGTTYPPANGIRLDDNVADKYDIGTPGVPLALTSGSVDVVDLVP